MARNFNGSTDRIDWAAITDLTASPVTISFWMNYDYGLGASEYAFIVHPSGDGGTGMMMFFDSAVGIYFQRSGVTSLYKKVISETNLCLGAWHNITVTHDGTHNDYTTIHTYLDGTEITNGADGQNGATETSITGSWSVGGRIYDDARNFQGDLGEVAVWSRVIDSGEITAVGAGYSPTNYPTDLEFYCNLEGTNYTDAITSTVGVADGTAASASEPPITRTRSVTDGIVVGEANVEGSVTGGAGETLSVAVAMDVPAYQGTGVRVR